MDALSHRVAISRRFGVRIAAGDAVFMGGAVAGIPYTVSDGERRPLSGMNRLMLMQVMKDRAWTDPRFFTLDQVRQSGWEVALDAQRIGLQFLVSTDKDGLPLETPESKLFHVFNASEVKGVPESEPVPVLPVADVETTVQLAGIGASGGGLREGVQALLEALQDPHEGADAAAAALRVELATTLLEAQSGPLAGGRKPRAAEWVSAIEADPLSLFQAVKDAESLAAEMISLVKAVGIERQALEDLAQKRDASLGSAQEKSGVGMARKAGASARIEAMFAERAAVLAVPYAERGRANALGAEWYGPQSLWFVPKGVDVALFKEWNPRTHALGGVATEKVLIDSFIEAMQSIGLDTTGEVLADGKWHNVAVDSKSKRKNLSGSYILSLDGARDGGPIGTINNKHTGEQLTWRYEGGLLTPEQRARFRAEALAREAIAAREIARAQEVAAQHAAEIWAVGQAAEGHGYVTKKGISADAFRQVRGSVLLQYAEFKSESGASAIRPNEQYLIVPMADCAGVLRAVQAISSDGTIKAFMRGAQKKGTMLVLGADSFDQLCQSAVASVAFVEGCATGASFHAASAMPVTVCFDAGNLETVVQETTSKLRDNVTRILAVDNDQFYVERAIGLLSEKLGVNPHAPGGESVKVLAGAAALRSVAIGGAVADGQWHQTARGSYSMTLNREAGSEAVNSVVVEVVPNGSRKISATFGNRGIEAGKVAMQSIVAVGASSAAAGKPAAPAKAVIVAPEFVSVVGRPTDWNDLAKAEGSGAILALLRGRVELPIAVRHEPARVGENRRVASLAR